MMGPQSMMGPCWFDFTNKKTRNDGTMDTPFGPMQAQNTKWWDQSYSECVAIQGQSGCAYFDPTHTHSVSYMVGQSPFGAQCTFTYKEAKDDQLYPLDVPPFATYSAVTEQNKAADQWTWSLGNVAGSATFTVVVDHADPSMLMRFQFQSNTGGFDINTNNIVTDFQALPSIDASTFTTGLGSSCKLQDN